MTQPLPPNEAAVRNRRIRLRRWIDEQCGGSQVQFIASTADGDRQLNQGELSGLLKAKSFGEKKARSLERQAGMPAGYLDASDTISVEYGHSMGAREAQVEYKVVTPRRLQWPFQSVTAERLAAMKDALGPRLGSEAMRDIDELLDILVTKWERHVGRKKNNS